MAALKQADIFIKRHAVFSVDRAYRYLLEITWDEQRPRLPVIGLNPSTADEVNDDPTLRRAQGFARRLNFGGIEMLNLFAFRSTQPKGLLDCADPIGAENDYWLEIRTQQPMVLAAWGTHADKRLNVMIRTRAQDVCGLALWGNLYCYGHTKDWQPKHLLYLPYTSELKPLL